METRMTVSSLKTPGERLAALGLSLPAAAAPVANYLPYVRTGDLLFVSGQLPVGSNGVDPAY
jgi:enamine deaminase RidA (YjgF/YER057c/UK114 family)